MPPHAKQMSLIFDESSVQSAFPPITRKSLTSSSSSSSSKPSKSVSFNQSVRVQKVLHIRDYTKEEIASSFYSSSEMSCIKRDTKEAVQKLETLGIRKCRTALVNFCTRGLEQRTREGAKLRSQNKVTSVQTVIEEQKRQKSQGVCDPNRLAFVYLSESRHCLAMAQETGMDDEEESKEFGL
jgi:hypothetical protein